MAQLDTYKGPQVLVPHFVFNVFGNPATTGAQSYLIDTWVTKVAKDVRGIRLPFDTEMYIQRRVFNTSVIRTKGRMGPPGFVYYNVAGAAAVTQSTEGERNALKNRAWSNMGSGNLNLANTLGELGQTSNMIASRATSVAESLRALRRKDLVGAITALGQEPSRRNVAAVKKAYYGEHDKAKRVGNAWLELQFGWKPLLSDIYAAVELTNTGLLTTGMDIHSGSGVKPQPRPNESYSYRRPDMESGYHVLPNGKRYVATVVDKPFTGPLAAHAAITAKVRNPHLANLQQLGLLNPASLAWELLPWSFAIDWLVPIGTWLNNLTGDAGLSDIRGSVVTERRVEFSKVNGTWLEHQQNIWRTPIDGFGIPRFLDMANLTIEKALSALALAKQRG